MDLMAYRTGHRLINVLVLRSIFGGKALNAVSSFRAAVREERHVTASRSASQNGLMWINLLSPDSVCPIADLLADDIAMSQGTSLGNGRHTRVACSKRSDSQYSKIAAAVATLSEFAIPNMGIATAASAASIASGETPLRSPPSTACWR